MCSYHICGGSRTSNLSGLETKPLSPEPSYQLNRYIFTTFALLWNNFYFWLLKYHSQFYHRFLYRSGKIHIWKKKKLKQNHLINCSKAIAVLPKVKCLIPKEPWDTLIDVGGLVGWGLSHMFILSKCLVENIYSQTLPPPKKRTKEKEKKERKDSNPQ